jgi:hypothetical protein
LTHFLDEIFIIVNGYKSYKHQKSRNIFIKQCYIFET